MKKTLILSLILAFPFLASASIDANLKYGSRGSEVIELQEFLISKGFLSGAATGNFFSLTNAAVKAYQGSVSLPTTGYVGPLTRGVINKELASLQTEANTAEQTETGAVAPTTNTTAVTKLQTQIQSLQDQLKSQADTQNRLLQSVVTNTAPVLGSTPIQPVVAAILSPAQCLPDQNGNQRPTINLSVTGADWKQANISYLVDFILQNNEPVFGQAKAVTSAQVTSTNPAISFSNFDYTYTITGEVYRDYSTQDSQKASLKIADISQTISVTKCQ